MAVAVAVAHQPLQMPKHNHLMQVDLAGVRAVHQRVQTHRHNHSAISKLLRSIHVP